MFQASSSNIRETFPDAHGRSDAPKIVEFIIRSNYAVWSIKKQLGWGLEIRLPGFKPQVHLSGAALTSVYLNLLISKMRIVTGPAPQGTYEDEMSSNGRSNWTSRDSSYTAL